MKRLGPIRLPSGGVASWNGWWQEKVLEGSRSHSKSCHTPQPAAACWRSLTLLVSVTCPRFSGWGIEAEDLLVLCPETLQETSWSIEQCLRCPGISATWAWVDERIPARVHRRWQMAAEVGGGVGLFFRPVSARREPVWADLRLLVTPRPGGQGETRRLEVQVLYRRGGLGGGVQTWEIDHAAGLVRLVPEMADPAASSRSARAGT